MKYATKTISVVAIISVVCVFATARAGAGVLPKIAKLVPPETVLLVDIDNFSRLKSQFEKTNFYELYKLPAMSAFADDFKTRLRRKIQELDNNDIFKTIYNADVLPEGRVAVALVLNEQTKDANEPPILFIAQWGEKIDKVKEAIKKMVEKNTELGGHQKPGEDFRGVRIETVIDEESAILSYCFIDDCYIGSGNLDILKFVIAQTEGAASPTLADDADYNAAMKTVGPYHDIDIYLNIKQIIAATVAEDTTGRARTTIANLGLDNVAALGCSVGLARSPGTSVSGRAFLKLNGTKKGLCRMLEPESAVLRAPPFIPGSAYSVSFLNLDITKAYNELYNILYSINPATAAMMHLLDLPPGPDGRAGLQLKTDIIDHLGSQIVIAQSARKPFSMNSAPTETLYAVSVVNRHALERSLSLLHSRRIAPNNPEARRELLGYTIYLVEPSALLPAFPPGGRTPMQNLPGQQTRRVPALAFTITDTHLIFGVESTVERAIRTLSSTEAVPVSSAKWFNSAKSTIPSVVGLAGLQDNVASSEFLWWMLKQTAGAKTSEAPKGPNPAMILPQTGLDLFDFGLLPQFDVVRRYFGPSAFYGLSRPDGFFFEFNYLNPGTPEQ